MTSRTMIIQSNPNSNFDYSVRLNRWCLKPIGAWPCSSSAKSTEKVASLILNLVCYCFMMVTLIPSLLHMFLEIDSFYEKMKVMAFVSHWCITGINYTSVILRRKEIRESLEQMEYDWKTTTNKRDQEVMLENARFGQYVGFFCTMIFQISVIYFSVISAIATQVITVGNETKIVHGLPSAVYEKIIDVHHSPTYEIILTLQMISILIVNMCVAGTLSLVAITAAHACGQLNVLMLCITEYVNEARKEEEGDSPKKIRAIVEHHTRILRFIARIEDILNFICFMELFRCGLAICVLGYYTLAEWNDGDVQSLVTYTVIMISIAVNAFVMCYVGDLLTEQCRKIGDVTYMTNWYYLPNKRINDLQLIIVRSHVVVELTAAKLIHLSVYTFSDVLKTGFAYLNLLSQLYI